MLKTGCILVYSKYWTLNRMPLMVYPKVLSGVDVHRYIPWLASGQAALCLCPGAGAPFLLAASLPFPL